MNQKQPDRPTENPASERAEPPEELNVAEKVQEEAAEERENERGYQ